MCCASVVYYDQNYIPHNLLIADTGYAITGMGTKTNIQQHVSNSHESNRHLRQTDLLYNLCSMLRVSREFGRLDDGEFHVDKGTHSILVEIGRSSPCSLSTCGYKECERVANI